MQQHRLSAQEATVSAGGAGPSAPADAASEYNGTRAFDPVAFTLHQILSEHDDFTRRMAGRLRIHGQPTNPPAVSPHVGPHPASRATSTSLADQVPSHSAATTAPPHTASQTAMRYRCRAALTFAEFLEQSGFPIDRQRPAPLPF